MNTPYLDDEHWRNPNHVQRVNKRNAQKILLAHVAVSCNGSMYFVKARSIGAGVYDIYKTPINPPID